MLTIRKHEGAMVVDLPPQPCGSQASAVATLLALQAAGRASTRLIVDLGRVRHVEGELLGLLVRTWNRLGARPGDIVLVANELQQEVFTVTRLERLFVLADSRDAAVRAPWPEPVPAVTVARGRVAG